MSLQLHADHLTLLCAELLILPLQMLPAALMKYRSVNVVEISSECAASLLFSHTTTHAEDCSLASVVIIIISAVVIIISARHSLTQPE
jgi:hypothetical protein